MVLHMGYDCKLDEIVAMMLVWSTAARYSSSTRFAKRECDNEVHSSH